jgi:hypothetical protein
MYNDVLNFSILEMEIGKYNRADKKEFSEKDSLNS